jgi:hypothetical protein
MLQNNNNYYNNNNLQIGDVIDTEKGSTKKMLNGKEYDYVFDVDISEGSAPLKLGFNRGGRQFIAFYFIHVFYFFGFKFYLFFLICRRPLDGGTTISVAQ